MLPIQCRNAFCLKRDSIFKFLIVMKLVAIFMLAISITVDAKGFVPPATITGRITTNNGIGLGGATVTEKGTKNSVVTNEDGAFAINTSQVSQYL